MRLLSVIYRASLAHNYIPQLWQIARVAFLPKPGRLDYSDPKAYRPISLTSYLLKGLEKLVGRFLRDGPLKQLPLHPRQHAFQAGKSTESALHQLVERLERAIEANQFALGIFFDIEGAFNNVSITSVAKALDDWNIKPVPKRWITAMLQKWAIFAQWVRANSGLKPDGDYLRVEDCRLPCGHLLRIAF